MRYWQFFPPEPRGLGRGVGTACRCGDSPRWSRRPCDGVEAGQRVYGYLPPAGHLVVRPDRVDAGGFRDASEHRADLPSPYNVYRADHRRRGLPRRSGGPADPVPAPVLHLVHARRPARRQRLLRRVVAGAVVGVEQDRLRGRVRAARARPARGRSHLARQRRVHRLARLLRRRRLLRRHRHARPGPDRLPRPVRRPRGPHGPARGTSATSSSATSRSG